MGIQGLTKYITTNNFLGKETDLRDCPIVLDGNSLPYHCTNIDNLEWKFGGQYPALRQAINKFFETLLLNNIQPIHVVFDGIDPKEEKMETLLSRRQSYLDTIKKSLSGVQQQQTILPPHMTETYRKALQDFQCHHRGVLKVYSADGEADDIAVCLANKFDCFLVGEDSDFFISPLRRGYIPLSKLNWQEPDAPIRGPVYKRELFASNLGIELSLILAIPAIVGNDTLPNLVEETSLKHKVRDNPRYRGKDTIKTIEFLQRRCNKMRKLEDLLSSLGEEVFALFRKSYDKAKARYEIIAPFNEDEFRMSCAYKVKDGTVMPAWLVEQYRDFKFSNNMLEVVVKGRNLVRAIPDDFRKDTTVLFTRCIRQEVYGIINQRQKVTEIIRRGYQLYEDTVDPKRQDAAMTIHSLNMLPVEVRRDKIFSTLQCDSRTLTKINEEWWLSIATLCFWVKNARLHNEDVHLKALLLCFVECYHNRAPSNDFQPRFDVETLHLLTQWQVTYKDALTLNQVLGLPLPYHSPADIFDGKRVTYYCQQGHDFHSLLISCSSESQRLFGVIHEIVTKNN